MIGRGKAVILTSISESPQRPPQLTGLTYFLFLLLPGRFFLQAEHTPMHFKAHGHQYILPGSKIPAMLSQAARRFSLTKAVIRKPSHSHARYGSPLGRKAMNEKGDASHPHHSVDYPDITFLPEYVTHLQRTARLKFHIVAMIGLLYLASFLII